jgi:dienelactone hydrolase
VRVFQGSADEEVSPRRCADLVARSRARGGDIEYRLYPDATHGFDDPTPSHQSNDANAAAAKDVIARATEFLAGVLRP